MEIRHLIYKFIVDNKEDFYIFFEGNEEINFNMITPDELLQDYIIENNKEGEYAGDIEYSAIRKLYNMHISLLSIGYYGYIIFNAYDNDNEQNENKICIYIPYS